MNEIMQPSQAWWEAVNSEFIYEQGQVHNMNTVSPYTPNVDPYQELQCVNPSTCGYPIDPTYSPTADSSLEPFHSDRQTYCQTSPEYGNFPVIATYPPCQGPRPWNYAYCYGYYGEPACPLINMVDMEDFM